MTDERLFDLLDLWEARLDSGIELSPEELAAGDIALASEIRTWIEPLKATRWMRSSCGCSTARREESRSRGSGAAWHVAICPKPSRAQGSNVPCGCRCF